MIATILISLFWALIKPTPAMAQYYSTPEVKKDIVVDKKIYLKSKGEYVDNIEKNQQIFVNGSIIEFSITIENSGSNQLTNINVTDYLPDYLRFYFYPGTYNKNLNQITWTIDQLNPGEKKSYLIRAMLSGIPAKVVNDKQTNIVEAKSGNLADSDKAVYYIGAATVPVTGNESIVLQTVLVIGMAGAGFGVRKLSRGY